MFVNPADAPPPHTPTHIHTHYFSEDMPPQKRPEPTGGIYFAPLCESVSIPHLPSSVFFHFSRSPSPALAVSMATLTSQWGRLPHSCCVLIQRWVTGTRARRHTLTHLSANMALCSAVGQNTWLFATATRGLLTWFRRFAPTGRMKKRHFVHSVESLSLLQAV